MKSLNLIKPYFRENKKSIFLGLFCLIIVDLLQLFVPRIIKASVDGLAKSSVDLKHLAINSGLIIAIAALIGLFRYGWRFWLIGLSRRIEEGLRKKIYDHVITFSPYDLSGMKSGDIMARASSDISGIRMASGMGIVALTDALFLGIASAIFMAMLNWKLALLTLIPLPMIAVSSRLLSRKMHKLYTDVQTTVSEITEAIRERLSGIRIIKAFSREADETIKVRELSEKYLRKSMKRVRVTGLFIPLMIFFTNLGLVIILFAGGRMAIRGEITAGDFAAFISYLTLMTWPMMAMGWVVTLIQRGKASMDRIEGLLSVKPVVSEQPDSMNNFEIKGSVSFINMGFSYGSVSGSDYFFRNFNLDIPPGTTLGITGPPGHGKTTLLGFLPRFYDPSEGMVMIDGIDIRNLSLDLLRKNISLMPQEPFLFSGTIRDNIKLDLEIEDSEIMNAARKAAIDTTIMELPEGLDTRVGEKGVLLSGGQKQRVALARVFLRPAPIILLDDPISQVDAVSASMIMESIMEFAKGKTLIIVSHRLSALKISDRIIVMENGEITESGNHDELVALGGYYSRISRMQAIEEELNAL
ncbi:ABC transporter ATP-binding protein [Desulforegula conservatrix]|uniref:ABC transporter ATP-binding protein n=1 Tax=Desulforegula conservatrix TaxID=153026 RepID=UPI000427C3A4|nr:ABC transporter ATP-binding protein [Desulforegula conservatrix]